MLHFGYCKGWFHTVIVAELVRVNAIYISQTPLAKRHKVWLGGHQRQLVERDNVYQTSTDRGSVPMSVGCGKDDWRCQTRLPLRSSFPAGLERRDSGLQKAKRPVLTTPARDRLPECERWMDD